MKTDILAQIRTLPPLSKSVLEVQQIANDPNSSIRDLIKIIKQDPMLTSNLLKAANSPLYGFSKQIKTIDRAVSLFGMATVKGFVLSFTIRNTLKFNLSAYGISEDRFHDIATYRNALAINWYRLQRTKLDIISTDSSLIDIGAVIISLYLIIIHKDREFNNKLTIENRYKLEKEYVGMTTSEITAEIFEHWHFSKDLINPLIHIDSPNDEFSAVMNVLRTIFNMLESDDKKNIDNAIKKAKQYKLDVENLKAAIELVKENI